MNPAICTFKNNYILKFGGLGKNLEPNNTIELYDIKKNKWTLVDATFS